MSFDPAAEGLVVDHGKIHIVLRNATETICGLPAGRLTAPEGPNLSGCKGCLDGRAAVLNRDILRELSRPR